MSSKNITTKNSTLDPSFKGGVNIKKLGDRSPPASGKAGLTELTGPNEAP